jgi:hypothetical protein
VTPSIIGSSSISFLYRFDCSCWKPTIESIYSFRLRNLIFGDEIYQFKKKRHSAGVFLKLHFSRVDRVVSCYSYNIKCFLDLDRKAFFYEISYVRIYIITALTEMFTELLNRKPQQSSGTARRY